MSVFLESVRGKFNLAVRLPEIAALLPLPKTFRTDIDPSKGPDVFIPRVVQILDAQRANYTGTLEFEDPFGQFIPASYEAVVNAIDDRLRTIYDTSQYAHEIAPPHYFIGLHVNTHDSPLSPHFRWRMDIAVHSTTHLGDGPRYVEVIADGPMKGYTRWSFTGRKGDRAYTSHMRIRQRR